MEIEFTEFAWKQFSYWVSSDTEISAKIIKLLEEIKRTPFVGTGYPEPLKGNFKGYWSRRINSENRLIYRVIGKKGIDQRIRVVQCRYHYDDN